MIVFIENHLNEIGAIFVMTSLSLMLITKMRQIGKQKKTIEHLQRLLDEMDEQAKLIVRTDMELNKIQDELDHKITGLYALHTLSRAISTTLQESQIFETVQSRHIADIGFEKAFAFLADEKATVFSKHLAVGYSDAEIDEITSFINSHRVVFDTLIAKEKTYSSKTFTQIFPYAQTLGNVFRAQSFFIAPLLPREGSKGFFFIGTQSTTTLLTEGDEDLIVILTHQISQAIENARLFEKTWKAQQQLEKKVEERTRELTSALTEVKKISRRKSNFVSNVSHELRTPLTSIKGYASILLAEKLGPLPPEVKERLAKINRHSDELVHMVNDLLDISRIEAGRVTMKQEPQVLSLIIGQIRDLLSIQIKEKQLDCIIELSPDAQTVRADYNQLERVFINLIGNAIKFTPIGGRLIVRSAVFDGAVRIDVTDSGCGIAPEDIELIFDEFYRAENPVNEQVKGTGLGLALSKHIIEAHGGKIWVTSTQGAGATFSFTLPKG